MKKQLNKTLKKGVYMTAVLLAVTGAGRVSAQHISLGTYAGQTEIKATGSVTLTDGFYIPAGNTVRIFTGASFQNCTPLVWAPSANQNYIRSRVFKVPGVTTANIDNARSVCEVNQTVQYMDGLGRELQIVTVQGSPTFRDIVQPVEYDAFGREVKKYLPYTAALGSSNGSYKSTAITDQVAFYNNPAGNGATGVTTIANAAFAETKFEASPLNRVLEQGAPGASWQLSAGHTQKLEYGTNNTLTGYTTTGFAVRLYKADPVTTSEQEYRRTLSGTGYYNTNELALTISKDENWVSGDGKAGTAEEYKDKDGRIMLKRVFNRKPDNNIETLSTYYVYDDYGNLSFVLPPGADPDVVSLPTQTVLDNFCYQYRYDGRKRLIEKKLPGKGWEHMVYNKIDQVVLSQDAVQRNANKWLFSKYDAFGRVVVTGVHSNAALRDALQTAVNGQAGLLWETRDNGNANSTNTGYSNTTIPSANISEYLSINYYDDYDFYGNSFGQPNGIDQVIPPKTKGLQTGSSIYLLGSTTRYLSVSYYNEEGLVIQNKVQNHLGGLDVFNNTYNFAGELTASTRTHTGSSSGIATTIATRYDYDHMGRKKATFESINGADEIVLSKLDYNEVGQLLKKDLHSSDNGSTFIQNSTYAYNERGWMSKINDPTNITATTVFGMELTYANKADAYNGNIGRLSWQTKVPSGLGLSQQLQSFVYDYDKLNRLKKAGYTTAGSVDKFNEELEYDLMGNIIRLKRKNTTTFNVFLNDLEYDYLNAGVKGNRLLGVSDAGTGGQSSNYTYDVNGNQKTDSRKGISIDYNYLNFPQTITKASTSETIIYTYDAAGRKLRKVVGSTSRDYIDGIEYSNGSIDFIRTEEGRAVPGASYTYEYMLKDHLGNTRVTIKQNGDILQVQDYYAFGMDMNPGNTYNSGLMNQYKYNGKEKQTELALEQYDYGARFYDPVIGRWNVVDPLAEMDRRLSTYNYASNNPVRFIDPDGMAKVEINGITTYSGEDAQAIISQLQTQLSPLQEDPKKKKVKNAFIMAAAMTENTLAETALSTGLKGGASRLISGLLGVLFLSGDNESAPVRRQKFSQQLVDYLNEGDTKSFLEAVSNWNTQPRNQQDRIVFRYLSQGEYDNIYKTIDGERYVLPFDRNGNFSNKYISPDAYISSKAAQSKLALPNTPHLGVFTFESLINQTKSPTGPGNYSRSRPKYGQPGGGREAIISQPFPVIGGFKLNK